MKNADRYKRNALDSIANQQFDDVQVIEIDDDSDDTDIFVLGYQLEKQILEDEIML